MPPTCITFDREGADVNAIYMDYAATTPLSPEVLEVMLPWLHDDFGNPSSPYRAARRARAAVDDAREQVAGLIGARPSEIYFTSGGTEAANLALAGRAFAPGQQHKQIVATTVEHQAVLQTAAFLGQHGWRDAYVPVDEDGVVAVDALTETLREATAVAAVMYANNEIGTIQPLAAVSAVTRANGVPLFVDAVQAAGLLPVDVDVLHCELLALSAHKFYGPKGVGVLYARTGVPMTPHVHGGAQERGLRAGTENVAGIVGCARALALAVAEREAETARLTRLRDRLSAGILAKVPHAVMNGHPTERLPNNVNVSFPGVDGESLLLNLDRAGVAASGGSACTSGSLHASHVLLATGRTRADAESTLRLTVGKQTTTADVARVVDIVADSVARLRERARVAAQFAPGS